MKTNYVVGFAFWRGKVLLLHKTKGPSYVVGKLNGVGGKIEKDELPVQAMSREFMEETEVETWPSHWTWVAQMSGADYVLSILFNHLPDVTDFSAIKNPEQSGETLEWVSLDKLNEYAIVENLSWIIPLCLDSSTPFLKISEE